jgi:DNA-binding transcriptional MocR family regulator
VLYCGSFAKSFAPGCCFGWAAAGRFAEHLEHLERVKWMTTLSASGEFRHCIRLNYGHPWSPGIEHAMETRGALAQDESLISSTLAGPVLQF